MDLAKTPFLLGHLCLAGTGLGACPIYYGLDINDVPAADLVVTGRVSAYEVAGPVSGRFRFDVEVVLRGEAPDQIEFMWNNSTFGVPETFYQGNRMLVALRSPDPSERGGLNDFTSSPIMGEMVILQAHCSRPFIIRADSLEARKISLLLDKLD